MISETGKSGFLRRKSLTRAAIFDPTLPKDLIDQLWQDPEGLVRGGELMRRTGLRRIVRLHGTSTPYVLKHYRPTWWHFVRQLPLRSWAFSTFKATVKLIDAGITTPRPVACVENRWGGLRRDSFLMYEYVEGVTLRSFLNGKPKHARSLSDNLSGQLHELWQRLEDLRASLADTHTGNFIVCPAGNVWVIDLDKARFHRSAYMAARHQRRGWEQLLRSTAKCSL